jgi:hypothetical protein
MECSKNFFNVAIQIVQHTGNTADSPAAFFQDHQVTNLASRIQLAGSKPSLESNPRPVPSSSPRTGLMAVKNHDSRDRTRFLFGKICMWLLPHHPQTSAGHLLFDEKWPV